MRSFSFTDFIKRALPFFAALVIGVFIASFFVDLSRPRFGRHRMERWQEMQRLRIENEELKNENLRLRNQLENHDWHSGNCFDELQRESLKLDNLQDKQESFRFETNELPVTAIDGLPAPPPVVKKVK